MFNKFDVVALVSVRSRGRIYWYCYQCHASIRVLAVSPVLIAIFYPKQRNN